MGRIIRYWRLQNVADQKNVTPLYSNFGTPFLWVCNGWRTW